MFGKPKSSKRPASARRRAEADEEDDPEVRALMAQIHEMAAQVYDCLLYTSPSPRDS